MARELRQDMARKLHKRKHGKRIAPRINIARKLHTRKHDKGIVPRKI